MKAVAMEASGVTVGPTTHTMWCLLVPRAPQHFLQPYFQPSLSCTTLCPAGKKDHLCPYASAVAAVAKAPKGTLVTFDVGHFDPYVEPTLGPSLAKQIEFLKQHAV